MTVQDDEEPFTTDHADIREMSPTLGEVSATIGDISATIRNIYNHNSEPYTKLPTLRELSTTMEEISPAITIVSTNLTAGTEDAHSTEELPIATQSCLNVEPVSQPSMSQEQTVLDHIVVFSRHVLT